MKKLLVFLLALTAITPLWPQKGYRPSVENIKNREAFRDNKFGVFIHWGIYSMMAEGEWVMYNKRLGYGEYSKLARGFYPSAFSAEKWVADIKSAGAKYICITSRHHDGFSMFDTKYSDYNIVKASPFGRDILKELAAACKRQDIKLHIYYSLLDWSRADYNPQGPCIAPPAYGESPAFVTYHRFMKNQLTELLTNYGDIGAIWFDGHWDKPKGFDWQYDDIYSLIHKLQPACLIINNHHQHPIDGEDAQTFERDLPGQNTAGYSAGASIGNLPLETCETMNSSWGYKITDNNYKSEKTLIHYLVKAAGNDTNLLINVGPRPDGTFPETAVARLKAIGRWLRKYGDTIYGTRKGCVPQHHWGVTTQRDNRTFVHILNLEDNALFLPIKGKKVRSANVFATHQKVRFTQTREGVFLLLDKIPDEIDYVIELRF